MVEEEDALEEEHAEEKKKRLYDDTPHEDGWKVSGTIQNNQNYKKAPFIEEVIQVGRRKTMAMTILIRSSLVQRSKPIDRFLTGDGCGHLRYHSRSGTSDERRSVKHRNFLRDLVD